ncbi:WG repeat protein [Mucilaginibacter oryzae]|uniref:WG repeat protein n=1 Tax=Mucilaginibacter oryzae TaxID=468058 RepID=A0A316HIQ0_9SPHI|nr:WG repeat-containing protein [Mucilaginibacter oryzae]PWK80023.1 WG repeat protein [Mucilaginibacter oryzae]
MKYQVIFVLSFLAITICDSSPGYSQNNSGNNAIGKAIKDIGAILKKKRGNPAQPASSGTDKSPAIKKGNAGEIAPGAVSLDVDRMYDFNNGLAVVQKGSSTAVINPKGTIVVPFNTYDFSYYNINVASTYAYFSNGMFHLRTMDHQQWEFMNSSAKIIAVGVLNELTENKRQLQINNSGKWTYTTPDGKKYSPGDQLYDVNEGIGIIHRQVQSGVYNSYKWLDGRPLVQTNFDELYAFSEGLAVVGKKDQFGEIKYGYLNKEGKIAIPLMYSVKPGAFSGGYAKVIPKDKSAFEYAFINKKGEIVCKQTQADIIKYGIFDHFNPFGKAFSGKYILDSTFKLTSYADFFKSFGLPADSWLLKEQNFVENEPNPKLLFGIRGVNSRYTQQPLTGFINLSTGKVVAPVFDLLNVNYIYFDPAAKLAYAKVCIGKSNGGGLIYREGYINEDGQFVIVRGESGKW